MDDLIAFLRARLDEDEATARAATPGPWQWRHEHGEPWHPEPEGWLDYSGEYITGPDDAATMFGPGMTPHADATHIALHDPPRVLAEVAAKRQIVDAYEHWQRRADSGEELSEFERGSLAGLYSTCRALAEAHPDWRP